MANPPANSEGDAGQGGPPRDPGASPGGEDEVQELGADEFEESPVTRVGHATPEEQAVAAASEARKQVPAPAPVLTAQAPHTYPPSSPLHDLPPPPPGLGLPAVVHSSPSIPLDADEVQELDASEFDEAPATRAVGGIPTAPVAQPAAAAPAQPVVAAPVVAAPVAGAPPAPAHAPPAHAPPAHAPPPSPPPGPPRRMTTVGMGAVRPPPPPRAPTMVAPAAPPPPPAPMHAPPPPEDTGPALQPQRHGPPDRTLADSAVARARAVDYAAEIARYEAELTAGAAHADKARASELAYEIGELYERRLRDEAKAVKSYARSLQSDPAFQANTLAIRRIFYRRSLWPNLIKLIDAEVRFVQGDAGRAALWYEKGRILEDRVKNPAEAQICYGKALEADATHLGALMGLERLAGKDDAALAPVLRALAGACGDPARRAAYLFDLARVDERRGEMDAARAALEEAWNLGVDPERAVLELTRLAELRDRPLDLLAALELEYALREPARSAAVAAATAAGPDAPAEHPALRAAQLATRRVAALRRRQAQVARQAGDLVRATLHLDQALELQPDERLVLLDQLELCDAAASAGLAAADGGVGLALRRAEILHRLARGSDMASERLALGVRRAAALRAAGAGHEAAAQQALDNVWAEAPGYLPALIVREQDAVAAGPEGVERLVRNQLAQARAASEGTVFGPGTRVDGDPVWAAGCYLAAGDLLARAGSPDEAAAVYQQALAEVPEYRPAQDALLALAETSRRWDDVARLTEAMAVAARKRVKEDPGALAEALAHDERLLALYHVELPQPHAALVVARRLVEANPDSPRLRLMIDELCALTGEVAERLANLEEMARLARGPEAAIEVRLELARAAELRGDPARALTIYREILGERPQHAFAAAAIGELAARTGPTELAAALELERAGAGVEGDGGAHATLVGLELAEVYRRDLGRPADAAVVLLDVLDREPDRRSVRMALARAFLAAGDKLRAADTLEAMSQGAEGPARAPALFRLGEIYLADGNEDAAKEAWARAREAAAAPDAGGGAAAAAHATLALLALAARGRDAAGLAQGYAALAAAEADPATRAGLVEEVAWLTAGELGDVEAAAPRFAEAVELDPRRSGAWLGRSLSAARRGDRSELVRSLSGQADALADTTLAAEVTLRAAALAEGGGTGLEPATLRAQALARDPYSDAATWLLVECAPAGVPDVGGGPGQRAALLARRRELSGGGDRRAITLAYAEALLEAGQLRAAGEELQGLLGAWADDPVVLELVLRVCERAGSREGVYRASAHLGRVTTAPERAGALLASAARICDRELGRPEEAAPLYRLALGALPRERELAARLVEICVAAGARGSLAELYTHLITYGDEADRVRWLLERAQLSEARSELRAATEDYEALLGLDARHEEALYRLARLRESGNPESAAELWQAFTDVTTDPARRAPALERLAMLRLGSLGDKRGAIAALRSLLELDPTRVAQHERLVTLLIELGEYADAADACAALADQRTDPTARAQDELHAAEIMRDRCHDDSGARRALERALLADPLSWPAIEALCALHAKRGDEAARRGVLNKALRDLRAAIGERPGDARLYSDLAHVFKLAGDEAGRQAAAAALVALAAASPEHRQVHEAAVRERLSRPPRGSAPLPASAWARLLPPIARGPETEVIALLGEGAAEALGRTAAAAGAGKNERVAPKQVAAQHGSVDAIAATLGVAEYELYVQPGRRDGVQVFAAPAPGAVLMGAAAAAGASTRARWEVGRALALVRLRVPLLDGLPLGELQVLLAAALRIAHEARTPVAGPVAEREKALLKAMPRRDRKALQAMAGKLTGELDAAVATALLTAAERAGVLVGGDVAAACEALGGKDAPRVRELLAWSVSDECLELRSEIGL